MVCMLEKFDQLDTDWLALSVALVRVVGYLSLVLAWVPHLHSIPGDELVCNLLSVGIMGDNLYGYLWV